MRLFKLYLPHGSVRGIWDRIISNGLKQRKSGLGVRENENLNRDNIFLTVTECRFETMTDSYKHEQKITMVSELND